MDKLINQILFFAKVIFLLIAFVMTLYIMLVRMDTYSYNISSVLPLFIPLLLVLTAFVFSFFLKVGNDNMLFNIVGVLMLLAIIFIDYRTIFDNRIISKSNINLYFFDMQTSKIKIMLYLTFISNIFLIILEKKKKIHS